MTILLMNCSSLYFGRSKLDPLKFSTGEIINHIEHQQNASKYISAGAKITLDTPEIPLIIRSAMSLRDTIAEFVLYDVLGRMWGTAQFHGMQIDYQERESGVSGTKYLSDYSEFQNLPFDPIVIFTGILPIANIDSLSQFSVRNGKLFWEFSDQGKTFRYWISPEYYMVEKFEIEQFERVVFRCKLQKIRLVQNVLLPKFIQIFMPIRKSMVSIYYQDETIETE